MSSAAAAYIAVGLLVVLTAFVGWILKIEIIENRKAQQEEAEAAGTENPDDETT